MALTAAAESAWERKRDKDRAQSAVGAVEAGVTGAGTNSPKGDADACRQGPAAAAEVINREAALLSAVAAAVICLAESEALQAVALVTLVAALGRLIN